MKIQGSDHSISSQNEGVQEFSDGSKLKEKTFSGRPVSENDSVDKQFSMESDRGQKRLFFKDRHDRRVSTESNDSGYISESGNNTKKDDVSDHGHRSKKLIKTGVSVKYLIKLFKNWPKNESNSGRNEFNQPIKGSVVSVSDLIEKYENVESSLEVDEEISALDPFEVIVTGAVSRLVITSALDVMIGKEYEELKRNGSEDDLKKVYKCFEQALGERIRWIPITKFNLEGKLT